ncbi:EAL domain-containing protein [Massilia sp.]|uniref:bifunctional diguanylate cyclase/phosphodiesterase n=1 Tax=Massilia sp. TaxID=1882437 RepID=UPI0028A16BDC|nr:EAL domain-containing protein [Massilia sp.]
MDSTSARKLRHGLIALAIALPALLAVAAAARIVQDHHSTVEQAESDMRNIATTLYEHAMRTFGEADTHLRMAVAEIERAGFDARPEYQARLHEILRAKQTDSPLAASLGVLSPDGWILASAFRYPMLPVDARDRDYFVHLSAHDEGALYISRSVQSHLSGRWVIPVARKVNRLDGTLKMIVNFGVGVAYFDRFYRNLQLGQSGRLLLVKRDGWVLMETQLTTGVIGRNLAGTAPFLMAERPPRGSYETSRSAIDGTARVVGYASSPQSSVIAVASMSRGEVLQPWVMRSWQLAGFAAVSILLLLGLLRFLWLRLADLEAARNGLAARNSELDTARRRFQELVDGIDGVVWEATLPDFTFTYVSGNAASVSGYEAKRWIEDPFFWRETLCTDPHGRRTEALLMSVGSSKLFKPVEHHILGPTGEEIWLRSNVMLADDVARGRYVRGVTTDITLEKQSQFQLFEAIHIDPLTKLPSRRALIKHLEHALALAHNNHSIVAIILIDVDNFNTLNDSLGHEVGDDALVQIAARLQEGLDPTDILARMGGDEFAIVMEEVDQNALRVERLAESVHASLSRVIAIAGRQVYTTVSMGIAMFPQDGMDRQTLIRNADTALYRVKDAGRNGWQFFDSSMARQIENRLDMETALRHAVENREFRLYYQPQHSLEDGCIVGAEALVRWERPGVGMVPPHEFIRAAEESGFIVALGSWVLMAACCQAAEWRKAGLHVRVAVNVSAVQLQQAGFVDQVQHVLAVSGLPPHRLELEITEGVFVSDIPGALDKLNRIKSLGVELAMDDFGTGYSSLSYLKQMPVDRLKIDQSFVRTLPEDADDCAIVRAILAMAANLKLQVIAEGVESEDQLDFLRNEGCQEIQGYLLSPPVSPDIFIAQFMHAGRTSTPQPVTDRVPE